MFEDKSNESNTGPKREKKNDQKWLDGYWYSHGSKFSYLKVKGEDFFMYSHTTIDYPDTKPMMSGKFSYGVFDDAKPEIAEASGIKIYNVLRVLKDNISGMELKSYGVVNKAKNKMYFWGFAHKLEEGFWISDEDFERDFKNGRDPYEAPSIPYYEPTPDKPGKLLWFSGKERYWSSVQVA